MKFKYSNFIWGTFLLLAAIFVLVNQLTGFTTLGVGSIIAAILSVLVIVQCIAHLNITLLPIPVAVLYIVFQAPLNFPEIKIWILITAAILASIGLGILFPKKRRIGYHKFEHGNKPEYQQQIRTEDSNPDNNPSFNVNFGGISRRLRADSLETVQLSCNFGGMEIFLDGVELNPNGATAEINCSFGAIKLFIPRHWRIIDRINCTLGGVDIEKNFTASTENAPKLTLNGSVSFGGIEVRYV